MQTMTDTFLIHLVARATGETASEIGRRGFHSAMPLDVRFDPEPTPAASRRPRRPGRATTRRRAAGIPAGHDVAEHRVRPGAQQRIETDLVDLAEYGIDWETLLDHSLAESCVPACGRTGGAS